MDRRSIADACLGYRLGILVSKIIPGPMRMPTIRPDADFFFMSLSVTFLDNIGERREIPLDLSEIAISNFLPLGFQGSL